MPPQDEPEVEVVAHTPHVIVPEPQLPPPVSDIAPEEQGLALLDIEPAAVEGWPEKPIVRTYWDARQMYVTEFPRGSFREEVKNQTDIAAWYLTGYPIPPNFEGSLIEAQVQHQVATA